MSAAYNVNECLHLHLIAEMNGKMALLEQDEKDKMFSHMYLVTGFRPEMKPAKKYPYHSLPALMPGGLHK